PGAPDPDEVQPATPPRSLAHAGQPTRPARAVDNGDSRRKHCGDMELVLGQQELLDPGGTETYLLTVAEHLQRLGHEVTIFTVRAGTGGREAESRGLGVAAGESEPPADCDGVIAQDGVVSLTLAGRYERAPQLFVAHAPGNDVGRPVQLEGVISA